MSFLAAQGYQFHPCCNSQVGRAVRLQCDLLWQASFSFRVDCKTKIGFFDNELAP